TPFEVTDTGSNPYLRAVGTHDPFYGSYPGLLVYQHINGWNGNTLYLGDMQFATSSIQLGHASGGSGEVDTTVAGNLTVNGSYFSGGVDRANSGTFSVCGGNCTTLQHGGTATTLMNFNIGGATKWALGSSGDIAAASAQTFDTTGGTVRTNTLDSSSGNTINLGGTNATFLVWSTVGGDKTLTAGTAAADTVGTRITITAGRGGDYGSSSAAAGGQYRANAGNGGAGDATHTAAGGAAAQVSGGGGGTNNGGGSGSGGDGITIGGPGSSGSGSSPGGTGGAGRTTGGSGGAGTATAAAGTGGQAVIV